ncbi:MAG TPA: YggT family protein [Thermoanaerobaculia bacterium]|nr:YggT family protein [Thermoanaerobaculia bacterium]
MNAAAGLAGIFVNLILWIFRIAEIVVIVWVIVSWIVFFASRTSLRWRHRGIHSFLMSANNLLSRAVGPMIRPFQRLLPAYKTGGIDWSPLMLILALNVASRLVIWAYGLILFP